MKKKVLYGVIMTFLMAMSLGTLQSCTDDLSDLRHEYAAGQYDLRELIKALDLKVDGCISTCQQNIEDLQNQITWNHDSIQGLDAALKQLAGEVATMASLENLQEDLDSLGKDLRKYYDRKDSLLRDSLENKIAAEIGVVNVRIHNLDSICQAQFDSILPARFNQISDSLSNLDANVKNVQDSLAKAYITINTHQLAIDSIKGRLSLVEEMAKKNGADIALLQNRVQKLEGDLDALQEKYDAQFENLNNLMSQAFSQIKDTQDMITKVNNYLSDKIDSEVARLQSEIDTINDALNALQEQFDALTARINDLITSILVQGTDNPIFGNFSLPLGVQSNLLFNWYFENGGKEFTFPNAGAEYDYAAKGDMSKMIVTAQELARAIASKSDNTYPVPNGYEPVELGKLYVTLNPVGHNLTAGKTFWLESSKGPQGGRLPFELELEPSNDELYFGYTRGLDNGFYESVVTIPGDAESIGAAKIAVDQKLKDAAEALLNSQTKRNAVNLLKAVYDQINGSFKSYAVRADWMNGDKASRSSYSVLSKYDLAVATARPISFKFLEGKHIDRRLRTFGHIDNFLNELIDKDKFKFELNTTFEIEKFTIKFEDLTFNFSINPDVKFDQNIVVNVTTDPQTVPVTLYDENGNPVSGYANIPGQEATATITPNDLKPLTDAITSAFQEAIENMSLDLGKQINEQIREKLIAGIQDQVNNMLDDIQSQINKMLSDLESQINGQIGDMIDDVMDNINSKAQPWFDRLNKLVDIYNRVANKINDVLADPNAYLQPVVYYQTNGRVHIASMNQKDPTLLVNAGGDAFTIYPTTYTAEILVPVYKKFVACTNVFDARGNVVADVDAQVQTVNQKSPRLAVVLDARSYRIPITVKNVLKAGYTYEFVYQALDYSGVTSTKKFYIKVK